MLAGNSALAVEGDHVKWKQIEAQLRRMTLVILEGVDAIIIRDLAGRVLDINKETERVFGWSREDILGQPAGQYLPAELQPQADDMLARMQRGESLRNVESAVRTWLGRISWRWNAVPGRKRSSN